MIIIIIIMVLTKPRIYGTFFSCETEKIWAEQFLDFELPLKEREEMKVRKFFEWIGAVN